MEYALFLALIGGAVIFASDAVSYAMNSSLLRASMAASGHVAVRHLPLEDIKPGDDLLASLAAPGEAERVQMFRVGAVALALFCAAGVWYGLYCRRTRKTVVDVSEESCALPSPAQQDAIFAKRQQILRILSTDMHALLDSQLEVRHLMSKRLVFVSPKTTLEELRQTMQTNKVRHLLVCSNRGLLVGIVTDRDLTSRTGTTAQELMTSKIETLEPSSLVYPAITLMINRKISCLPVVEDGIPCGVLTATDLMMTLQCTMQVLQKVAKEIAPAAQIVAQQNTISGRDTTPAVTA